MKHYRARSQMFHWLMRAMEKGRTVNYFVHPDPRDTQLVKQSWEIRRKIYRHSFFYLACELGFKPVVDDYWISINKGWIRFLQAIPTGAACEHSNIIVIVNSDSLDPQIREDLLVIPVRQGKYQPRCFEIETGGNPLQGNLKKHCKECLKPL